MNPPRHAATMILLIVLATGCSSSDDRLVRHVAESNRQQAAQNQEIAKVHREVAEGTSRLVEAVAESRKEMVAMESDLQEQRTQLDEERRAIANERHRESLLAPIVSSVGLMLVAALPLVLCLYLLHGLRTPDEDVSEVLIQNLVSEQLALPQPPDRQRIEQESPPALGEDPPF
ncbi:MAG: hypothetical protein QGF59_06210 [Pirellulaceae bacterium]|jgi:hypothetical protein|nr:hypothetical protein [Pirellulaceae bacterium]